MHNPTLKRDCKNVPRLNFTLGVCLNYRKWIAQKRQEILKRVKASRGRKNAEKISAELRLQNQLREFYFSLPENELKTLWNNGDNELTDADNDLVRIALRNKLGIK